MPLQEKSAQIQDEYARKKKQTGSDAFGLSRLPDYKKEQVKGVLVNRFLQHAGHRAFLVGVGPTLVELAGHFCSSRLQETLLRDWQGNLIHAELDPSYSRVSKSDYFLELYWDSGLSKDIASLIGKEDLEAGILTESAERYVSISEKVSKAIGYGLAGAALGIGGGFYLGIVGIAVGGILGFGAGASGSLLEPSIPHVKKTMIVSADLKRYIEAAQKAHDFLLNDVALLMSLAHPYREEQR